MMRKELLTRVFSLGLLALLGILQISLAIAQDNVSRKFTIIDKTNQTELVGVSLTNKRTKQSTATNATGEASLQAASGDQIQIQMVGYKTLVHVVTSAQNVRVELESQQEAISEVVVTALGIKRETRGLTYSTQQLASDAVNNVRDNSGNIMTNLTGKVAGATVTTSSTGPGGAARVVLRGNKSIFGNNNALVVVDGVPYDNSAGPQATGTTPNYGTSDGAANINPDDIESINILKGPSAAALYGVRGANGAIIITTKQG